MSSRREPLITGEHYHICTKSIAKFKIFNYHEEFLRMIALFRYYRIENVPHRFGWYMRGQKIEEFDTKFLEIHDNPTQLVKIVAYCIMPTHIHLIVQQMVDQGISHFMGNVLNSYSRYFNLKYGRRGPLWQNRFRAIHVDSNEYMLHLTRYIHLNPTTDHLVDRPGQWRYSSYHEYLGLSQDRLMCQFKDVIEMTEEEYKNFVEDSVAYQRDLAHIKHLLSE